METHEDASVKCGKRERDTGRPRPGDTVERLLIMSFFARLRAKSALVLVRSRLKNWLNIIHNIVSPFKIYMSTKSHSHFDFVLIFTGRMAYEIELVEFSFFP